MPWHFFNSRPNPNKYLFMILILSQTTIFIGSRGLVNILKIKHMHKCSQVWRFGHKRIHVGRSLVKSKWQTSNLVTSKGTGVSTHVSNVNMPFMVTRWSIKLLRMYIYGPFKNPLLLFTSPLQSIKVNESLCFKIFLIFPLSIL